VPVLTIFNLSGSIFMHAAAIGQEFLPYVLKNMSYWRAPRVEPVLASVDVEGLIQVAVMQEDQRFEGGVDNSEGLGLALHPHRC
jgi:hypothetical protein